MRDDEETVIRLRDALRTSDEVPASSELVWLGRNDGRIDVRLRDETGREHHIVAFEDGANLSISLVLTEPDLVPRRAPVAVVVNGPSGSGKSTLMRALSDTADFPWVVFDEPILGQADQRMLLWRERAPHMHRGFIDGMAALAAAGNAVAVAAAGHPQSMFAKALTNVHTTFVGLDCPIDVLIERERGRTGRWGGLALQSVGVHSGWAYDIRIDTSATPPAVAAEAVLATLP